MSMRTIIEINHDCLFLLEKDPNSMHQLIRAILDYSTSFSIHIERGFADPPPDGVRILGTRHHSETLELKVK